MMHPFKKAVIGVIAALILWVGGFAVFALLALTSSAQGQEETTDAIVVLTGGSNRVEEGLTLFANGRASHLFISGVYKDTSRKDILSLWTGDHALPPCCITLGYEATTTKQNAQETRDWIEKQNYSSIRLVTGDYHMARSKMELSHALPGIEIFIHPVRQTDFTPFSRHYWELLFSEYHKTLYRSVQLVFTFKHRLEREDI